MGIEGMERDGPPDLYCPSGIVNNFLLSGVDVCE